MGKRIYLKDGKGREFSCAHAAKITGCKEHQVRHYIRAHGVKTLGELVDIRRKLELGGNMALHVEKTFNTSKGVFTLSEIHAMHISKATIKESALYARMYTHGEDSEKLWEVKQSNGCKGKPRKSKKDILNGVKTCRECGESEPVVSFRETNESKCRSCFAGYKRFLYHKSKKLTPTKGKFTVKKGAIVTSNGRLYEVAGFICKGLERSRTGQGSKSLITGHRVMPNGQVLKRSFTQLNDDWRLA